VLVLLGWAWLVRTALRRGDAYNDLLRAQARGDADRAAALIARMRADPSLAGNEQLQVDLRFRSAGLRARAGELDSALAEVEPLRAAPLLGNGLFDSRIASLHYQAGDIEGYLAAMARAFDASGQAQLQRLDLAFAHARLGDAQRAQELLDGLERRDLSALHQPIALAADGVLLQRRGDAAAGLAKLAEAVAGFEKFAANPAVWPFQGILRGLLALALAQAGRRDEARQVLGGWEDVVRTSLDAERRRLLESETSA
jgi:predicted Zn-dependent protease